MCVRLCVNQTTKPQRQIEKNQVKKTCNCSSNRHESPPIDDRPVSRPWTVTETLKPPSSIPPVGEILVIRHGHPGVCVCVCVSKCVCVCVCECVCVCVWYIYTRACRHIHTIHTCEHQQQRDCPPPTEPQPKLPRGQACFAGDLSCGNNLAPPPVSCRV